MNEEMHAPTPHFRARLEREVLDAFHSEPVLTVTASRTRWRALIPLAAGLILGVGTDYAFGQVQDAKSRDVIVATQQAERELLAVKLDLARAAAAMTRKQMEAGVVSRISLAMAEAELKNLEAALRRSDLNLDEARITAATPRDELWSPLVNGRDFVKDRLTLDAMVLQEKLAAAEAGLAEADQRFRTGVISRGELEETRLGVEEARRQLDIHAQKLLLRKRFFDERLSPGQITMLLQLAQLNSEVAALTRKLELMKQREALSRERRRIGATDDLEVKRAEVDVLETSLALRQLLAQLEALRKR